MPIYEFACEDCDNKFETLVFNSSEEINCPKCGGKKVKKLLSCCNFKDAKGTFSSATNSGCSSCSSGSCSSCGSH